MDLKGQLVSWAWNETPDQAVVFSLSEWTSERKKKKRTSPLEDSASGTASCVSEKETNCVCGRKEDWRLGAHGWVILCSKAFGILFGIASLSGAWPCFQPHFRSYHPELWSLDLHGHCTWWKFRWTVVTAQWFDVRSGILIMPLCLFSLCLSALWLAEELSRVAFICKIPDTCCQILFLLLFTPSVFSKRVAIVGAFLMRREARGQGG